MDDGLLEIFCLAPLGYVASKYFDKYCDDIVRVQKVCYRKGILYGLCVYFVQKLILGPGHFRLCQGFSGNNKALQTLTDGHYNGCECENKESLIEYNIDRYFLKSMLETTLK